MRKQTLLFIFALFIANNVICLSAQGITFSGILDSSFSLRITGEDVTLGIEEYANLRMQARLRDRGTFYGALNLIAAAGDYAANTALIGFLSPYAEYAPAGIGQTSFVAGDNYITAIELERLYFRLNFDTVDFDGGLMRLPFGYGQVWGSSDFLNPKNPLIPDARPRAILGAALSWFPNDVLKLFGFGAAPRNPFSQKPEGWLTGFSLDLHFDFASIQTLYSFEIPKADSDDEIIYRAGLSLKADIIAGFVIDALYTFGIERENAIDGLSASAGLDYSLFGGNVIILAEYLYNGAASSTALGYGGYCTEKHYLYTGITIRFNDYTNMNAACIYTFSEFSYTPVISVNHDLFQGAVLTVTAQMPVNSDTFTNNGNFIFIGTAKVRLRF